MSAFDFFMKYFMYGLDINNENAVGLNKSKLLDNLSDGDTEGNFDNKMSVEPTAPVLELEPEVRISKTLSPLSFTAEPLENIDSPKKVKQNEIF